VYGEGVKGACGGILADVDFVDVAAFCPGRSRRQLTKGGWTDDEANGKQKISHVLKLANLS
jgi:hypothetical protein